MTWVVEFEECRGGKVYRFSSLYKTEIQAKGSFAEYLEKYNDPDGYLKPIRVYKGPVQTRKDKYGKSERNI